MSSSRQLVSSGSPLEPEIGLSRALRSGPYVGAARAHAQRFAQVRPACTFVEVSRFIDPGWLVEFELDAIISD